LARPISAAHAFSRHFAAAPRRRCYAHADELARRQRAAGFAADAATPPFISLLMLCQRVVFVTRRR
jgi:hypothetical protein